MANEQTTPLDPQSKALMDAALQARTDMTQGNDVAVPTGQEATPPPKPRWDDARKSIIERAAKVRQQQQRDDIQQMQQSTDPLPTGDPQPLPDKPFDRQPNQSSETVTPITNPNPASSPSQPQSDYVTVHLNGRPIQVSRRDIERAGGEQAYIRTRELTAQADQLAFERAQVEAARLEVQRSVEEARRLQEDIRSQMTPVHGAPASQPGAASGQPYPATGPAGDSGADINATIEEAAAMLWSGDRDDVAKAIRTIVETAAKAGQKWTPEDAANRALERLRAEQVQAGVTGVPAPQPPPQPQPVSNPVQERMFARINSMADAEYPELVKDPVKRAAALELLRTMAVDPKNQDRDAVDIARDACEEIELRFNPPRAAAQELKRGLPVSPSAGGIAPAPAEEQVPSPSEYVQMLMQQRRGIKA